MDKIRKKIFIICVILIILIAFIFGMILKINTMKKEDVKSSNENLNDIEIEQNAMVCGFVKEVTDECIYITRNTNYLYCFTTQNTVDNKYTYNGDVEEYDEVMVEKDNSLETIDYLTLEKGNYDYIEEGDIIIAYGNLNFIMQPKQDIIVLKSDNYKELAKNAIKGIKESTTIVDSVDTFYNTVTLKYCINDYNSYFDTDYMFSFFVMYDLPQNSNISEENIGNTVTIKFTKEDITDNDIKNGNLYINEININ
jgi:hypothetical protein